MGTIEKNKSTLKTLDLPFVYPAHPTNVYLFQSIYYSLLFLNFKEDGDGVQGTGKTKTFRSQGSLRRLIVSGDSNKVSSHHNQT